MAINGFLHSGNGATLSSLFGTLAQGNTNMFEAVTFQKCIYIDMIEYWLLYLRYPMLYWDDTISLNGLSGPL